MTLDAGSTRGALFDWPTVEYVKEPVELKTGESHGSPRMRHFCDCDHWYRDNDEAIIGAAPHRATDGEMHLPVCKNCQRRAEKHHNPRRGERITAVADEFDSDSLRGALPTGPTDTPVVATQRAEQQWLRHQLLNRRQDAECQLCGRTLPARMLVAAHIVPRRELNDAERWDAGSIAMLACLLGCDALFEEGYVVVDADGVVHAAQPAEGALAEAVTHLVGRTSDAHNERTAPYFARHRAKRPS